MGFISISFGLRIELSKFESLTVRYVLAVMFRVES